MLGKAVNGILHLLLGIKRKSTQAGGAAEGEEEADSLLSREPDAGLDPRTLSRRQTLND